MLIIFYLKTKLIQGNITRKQQNPSLCGSDSKKDESCCTFPQFKRPSKHGLFLSFHLFKVLLPCCNEKVTFRGFESSACDFQRSSRGTVCTQFDSSNKPSPLSQGYIGKYVYSGGVFLSRRAFKKMKRSEKKTFQSLIEMHKYL